MLFEFKKYDKDFFVEEILGFKLKGSGDVFYLQFEKEDMNTMYVIEHLCNAFDIERKELGISGLKDKNAITRQRICIYKSVLEKIGGTEKFQEKIAEIVKVIATGRHDEVLAIGRHESNLFKITLRFPNTTHQLDETMKKTIEEKISSIKKEGFPNCFGQQRFGKGNRNFKRALAILQEKKSAMKDKFEVRFKLQAFASMYFNHYALSRRKKGQKLLQGDIVTNSFHAWKTKVGVYNNQEVTLFDYPECKRYFPKKEYFEPNYYLTNKGKKTQKKEKFDPDIWTPTGLMLGYNMLVCPNGSKSFFRDWELIKQSNILEIMENIKKFQLWGIRRPLFVRPKNLSYSWDSDGLNLNFELPTGAYATVLLGSIFQEIDFDTCVQNKLTLPDEIES